MIINRNFFILSPISPSFPPNFNAVHTSYNLGQSDFCLARTSDKIELTLQLQCFFFKDVHRRQNLTADFFQTFRADYFGCEYLNFEKKKMLTVVYRGSFFKGLDSKIIGFVHI